ncbi:MAG: hypothetical protein HY718_12250 [Planctomycetes bacterium]|nr:hypothetical protein [Planctomycetota bacterium]
MLLVRRVLLLAVVVAAPAAAWGQQGKSENDNRPKDSGGIFTGSPLFWRTDWVLDLYVSQITRYYNLNKEQEEYTRKLLGQRVKVFLQDHERDVRSLLAEYMEYQMSQELPDAKAAQDFARRAGPLAREIRKEILEGNMRWREILDDQQRTKHDQDLKQMTMFFDNLEQGLERWKQGKVQPTDLPGRVGPRPTHLTRIEDAWDYWVRSFIQSYKLDEGQKQTAYSILRELKDEATRYREANKEKFAELETALKAIRGRTPKTDPEELAKYQEETARVAKQRAELERPITALFGQLQSRVDAIPTVDQRKARQAELDRLRLAARRPATRPAVAASRPAATNVAVGSEPGSGTP